MAIKRELADPVATDTSADGPPPPATAWDGHEHVTPPLQAHAQKLVEEAGSPELAKYAVDSLAEPPRKPAGDRDEFARRIGFSSYLDLFETSTRTGSKDGKNWFLTALRGGGWVVWNDVDLMASPTFTSPEEARRHLPSFPAEGTREG